jgi:hypothetical protein
MVLAVAAIVALLAPATPLQIRPPRSDIPTVADKTALSRAAAKCGVPQSAAYFIQYNIPQEPVLHVAASSETQFLCVMHSLPSDFSNRFGLETPEPQRP